MELSTRYPRPGWAEQDAELVFSTVMEVIRQTLARFARGREDVGVLTLDGALHTVLGLDGNGSPITPVLTWEDSRAGEVVRKWRLENRGHELYMATGCPLHPLYLPAKMAWWRESQPDVFKKVRKFVSLKAFILYRLTGELLEDQAIASGSGLLNIKKLDWDEEILSLAGVRREHLAPVVRPSQVIEGISRYAGSSTGLLPSTCVVVGSSDAAMSSLGSGSINSDQMTVMIGTSGAVRRLVGHPALDPQQRTFCYYFGKGRWLSGGAINNGGIVLRWFRDNFGAQAKQEAARRGQSPYAVMGEYAARIPPGSEGLLFLPFLAGERSPHWSADMRGTLVGLSLRHGEGHIVRAIMEGVCYGILSVFRPLEELLGTPREVRVTGGFTRSALWLQILSSVLGKDLLVLEEPEGSVLGAAAFAYHSLGIFDSFDRLVDKNPVTEVIHPDPELHKFYMEEFERYMRIYWKMREEFDTNR
jgi:gluconokinase